MPGSRFGLMHRNQERAGLARGPRSQTSDLRHLGQPVLAKAKFKYTDFGHRDPYSQANPSVSWIGK